MKKTSFHNCLTFEDENQSDFQLSLFENDSHPQKSTPPNRRRKIEGGLFKKSRKRQITTTPGVDLRNPRKYRVMLGDTILCDRLTLDQALEVVRGEG